MALWTPPGIRLPSGQWLPPVAGGDDWPHRGDGQLFNITDVVAASSTLIDVTAGAPAHTKGSWTELEASLPFDADGILVFTHGMPAAGSNNFLFDLGIGAAASEVVLISNLYYENRTQAQGRYYHLPLTVAEGARLSARAQGRNASIVIRLAAILYQQGFLPGAPFGRATTYGDATGDTGGVLVDPGGVANTKGAWSEIVASSDNPIRSLILSFGNKADFTRAASSYFLADLGIGAAGSETILMPDIPITTQSTDDLFSPSSVGPLPCFIPAGTRIAMRAQSNIATADNLFDIILYGFD